ncbi:MAG TPA: TlpA disulfide reductase family protein [Bryobacteraceae bacterium]|nr:TlpA disulfide reductase family protein [Bryobacteraceae bacterium]
MRTAALFLILASALAQTPSPFQIPPAAAAQPTDAEQRDLMKTVGESANSPLDLLRSLEAYLQKYPETVQRPDIELTIAKAAIEVKDDPRIVQYGERVLSRTPDDVLMLDRVSQSLLALGGAGNAQKAIQYARKLEDLIDGMGQASGAGAAQKQDDRDRARGRMLMVQSRARAVLQEMLESEQLASRAFSVYPSEETARVWAESLLRLGRNEQAVTHYAEAFAIPDPHAADSERQADRLRLGELYAGLHNGSEKGLGDLILEAYDRTSSLTAARRLKLRSLDPNGAAASAAEFTITDVDGKKLQMSQFAGKVLVLDFWATWCAPCRAQHPLYEQVKQHYGDRSDVAFLALNTDEDRSLVKPFLQENKWDSRVFFEDGMARLMGVTEIPTMILLDKQGKVASRMNGFQPENFVQVLISRIDAALAAH